MRPSLVVLCENCRQVGASVQAGWHVSSTLGNTGALGARLSDKRLQQPITESVLLTAVRRCAAEAPLYPSIYDEMGADKWVHGTSVAMASGGDAAQHGAGGIPEVSKHTVGHDTVLPLTTSEIYAAAGHLRYEAEWGERVEVMHRLLWGLWQARGKPAAGTETAASSE
jgi:hypothetical protein